MSEIQKLRETEVMIWPFKRKKKKWNCSCNPVAGMCDFCYLIFTKYPKKEDRAEYRKKYYE
jgi:hypothetical protein